jgi:hypothetical protein
MYMFRFVVNLSRSTDRLAGNLRLTGLVLPEQLISHQ